MFTLKPDVIHLAAWLCSRVKFICHERGGVSGGLLPVLPDCRPVCGEPVRSGAGKRCYGKCGVFEIAGIKTTKARCIEYSGPLLYISVVCPRGEALLLTSPVASNFIIRIVDDAVKQHKG